MTPKRAAAAALTAVLVVVGALVGTVHATTESRRPDSPRAPEAGQDQRPQSQHRIMVVCISPRPPKGTVTQTVTGATVTAMVTALVTTTAKPTATTQHGDDHGHGHGHADVEPDLHADGHAESNADGRLSRPTPTADGDPTSTPTGNAGCASHANVPDGSDGRGGASRRCRTPGRTPRRPAWRPTPVVHHHDGQRGDRLQGRQLPHHHVGAAAPASC